MQGIFTVLNQAASTVARTCSAVEKFAGAAENIGIWAEESTASFSDEARHKRRLNNELQRKEFDLAVQDREAKLISKKASTKVIAA